MAQQETTGQGGGLVGLLGTIIPQWMDYKYGRDPNVLYNANGQPGYMYGPVAEGSADTARAGAMFGNGPIGALPVGTVLLLAVGAFLLYKAA